MDGKEDEVEQIAFATPERQRSRHGGLWVRWLNIESRINKEGRRVKSKQNDIRSGDHSP